MLAVDTQQLQQTGELTAYTIQIPATTDQLWSRLQTVANEAARLREQNRELKQRVAELEKGIKQ